MQDSTWCPQAAKKPQSPDSEIALSIKSQCQSVLFLLISQDYCEAQMRCFEDKKKKKKAQCTAKTYDFCLYKNLKLLFVQTQRGWLLKNFHIDYTLQ